MTRLNNWERNLMEYCKLCHKKKPLKNSHINPKFITDWIKNTSVTDKFRTAVNPNKRVQDTTKTKLLCEDCEQLFSGFEKYFSETIFKPVINSYNPVVNYNDNLLKFAVSLSWRYLVTSDKEYSRLTTTQKMEAKKAEEQWRKYLLNEIELDEYEHHFFVN